MLQYHATRRVPRIRFRPNTALARQWRVICNGWPVSDDVGMTELERSLEHIERSDLLRLTALAAESDVGPFAAPGWGGLLRRATAALDAVTGRPLLRRQGRGEGIRPVVVFAAFDECPLPVPVAWDGRLLSRLLASRPVHRRIVMAGRPNVTQSHSRLRLSDSASSRPDRRRRQG